MVELSSLTCSKVEFLIVYSEDDIPEVVSDTVALTLKSDARMSPS